MMGENISQVDVAKNMLAELVIEMDTEDKNSVAMDEDGKGIYYAQGL